MRLSVKLSSDDSVAEAAGRDMAIALYTYGRVHGIQLQMHESFCGERIAYSRSTLFRLRESLFGYGMLQGARLWRAPLCYACAILLEKASAHHLTRAPQQPLITHTIRASVLRVRYHSPSVASSIQPGASARSIVKGNIGADTEELKAKGRRGCLSPVAPAEPQSSAVAAPGKGSQPLRTRRNGEE
jgi:hypothetical protein